MFANRKKIRVPTSVGWVWITVGDNVTLAAPQTGFQVLQVLSLLGWELRRFTSGNGRGFFALDPILACQLVMASPLENHERTRTVYGSVLAEADSRRLPTAYTWPLSPFQRFLWGF